MGRRMTTSPMPSGRRTRRKEEAATSTIVVEMGSGAGNGTIYCTGDCAAQSPPRRRD